VRLNCRDQQLQVLSEPLLFEDINLFGDGTEASSRVARNGASGFGTGVGTRLPPGMTLAAATSTASPSSPPSPAAASPDASTLSSPPSPAPLSPLLFEPVSEARLAENTKALRKELGRGGAPDNAATTELAAAMCKSVSGLAFWPKLILDDDGTGNAIGDVNGVDNREVRRKLPPSPFFFLLLFSLLCAKLAPISPLLNRIKSLSLSFALLLGPLHPTPPRVAVERPERV
jgi:hypothetical protein